MRCLPGSSAVFHQPEVHVVSGVPWEGLRVVHTHAGLHHHLHCTMQHTFRPVPVCACLCHLYALCSLDTCLLAWHLEPIVIKMMSMQVCSGLTDHAEYAQMTCDPQ